MSRGGTLVGREPQSLVSSDERPVVTPPCDVYENNDEFLIVADVPGVTADALHVNLDRGELTIVASRDVSPKDATFVRVEHHDCDYRRRFALPGGVDAGKIRAELKDGVLRLHLPRSEALKPRQIPVHTG